MKLDRRLFLLGSSALAACATMPVGGGVTTETFNLWPGNPPGAPATPPPEEIIERSKDPAVHDRAVLHVRTPTLKVFRPAKPNGQVVLVCPGGGYQRVVLDKEGDETAMRFAEAGVTAAVLIYRLPEDGWADGWIAPLQDAHRAIRMLRGGRIAPGVDPKRIGVLGFSAGGHLAATLTLYRGAATYPAIDDLDRLSPGVNFAALMYAAYLDGKGSPAILLGPAGPAPDLITRVNATAPPTFLVHAADDTSVPVENSVRMYQALKAAGVRSELHVFPDGGHGFGIAKTKGKPVEVWPDLFLAWLRTLPPDTRPQVPGA